MNTKPILGSDVDHVALSDIEKTTRAHKGEGRLEWGHHEKSAHHRSDKTLGPECGHETKPVDKVKWLFEDQMQSGGIIVSTSKPIP